MYQRCDDKWCEMGGKFDAGVLSTGDVETARPELVRCANAAVGVADSPAGERSSNGTDCRTSREV